MQIDEEIIIAATPAAVFDVLADICRWPHVVPAIEETELLGGGTIAVGSRFRETRTVHGKRETVEMTVVEFDAPALLVLTAEAHGANYRIAHTVAPHGEGTRLSVSFRAEPQSFMAQMLTPLSALFLPSIAKHLRADLAALKSAVEKGRA